MSVAVNLTCQDEWIGQGKPTGVSTALRESDCVPLMIEKITGFFLTGIWFAG